MAPVEGGDEPTRRRQASQDRHSVTPKPSSRSSTSSSPVASSSAAMLGHGDSKSAAGTIGDLAKPSLIMDDLLPTSDDEPEAGPSRPASRSPSPPARPPSPTSRRGGRKSSPNKREKAPIQLVTHLPAATEEALATFESLKTNWHQNNKVGKSKGRERDVMVCECQYRPGIDDISNACSDDGTCINRLTQIECMASKCNCGTHCQNRRFQNAEYAPLEVVVTEKKGYGLRASKALPAETFVFEYLGEVVEEKEMSRRMQQYKDEGIRHFYFMMLQREEFIDATKKGGLGRFINHSCNPNCQVAKWTVGKYMRMGIFTKRDVEEGEELSFNYNVDRYGNDAQPCYCGEPNCSGVLGGKTQTDIGGMDQLFIEALGISDEVDRLEARGSRRKKSRHLDEDYNPTLRPIEEEEVGKVVTAMRQATSLRHILQKLLSRVHMTQDVEVQRRLVRLHGFVLMAALIEEWIDDREIVLLALGSLARWPLIARNKVVDSGVDHLVTRIAENGEDEELSSLAKDLLNAWDALEMQYRIARKDDQQQQQQQDQDEEQQEGHKNGHNTSSWLEPRRYGDDEGDEMRGGTAVDVAMTLETAKAPNWISGRLQNVAPRPHFASSLDSPSTPQTPDAHSSRHRLHGHHSHSYHHPEHSSRRSTNKVHWQPSQPQIIDAVPPKKKVDLAEIIRQANESQAEQRRQAEEKARKVAEEEAEQRRKEKAISISAVTSRKSGSASRNGSSNGSGSSSSSKRQHAQTRPHPSISASDGTDTPQKRRKPGGEQEPSSSSPVERRLRKLMGEIVVKVMSRYSHELDRDVFKKHARELTNLVFDKELRARASSTSSTSKADDEMLLKEGLSSEKKHKVKVFADEYAKKLVARKAKQTSTPGASSSFAPGEDPIPAQTIHSSASSPSSVSLAATASTTATTISASAASKE